MAGNDFQAAVTDLRDIPREVRKELTPALKGAGEAVASDARRRASWSRRIPKAVRVVVRYGQRTAGVSVRVSAKRAPHARPYEGISAGHNQIGEFRHPLFGDTEHWYSQPTRPFLFPAGDAKRRESAAAVDRVVQDAAARHGFK